MKQIAEILLEIGAVHLRPDRPFRWTSGLLSPIYCDNRQIISHPRYRRIVAREFARAINENFSSVQTVAGTATAGIPHAAWVADLLDLPMLYVRSSSKGHGLKNQIEGSYTQGQKVIVVEDLISTGKSSLEAAIALKDAGLNVLGIVSIFTYQTKKAVELFSKNNLASLSLTNVDELLEVALENDKIRKADADKVKTFLENL